jgi:hypothetical protein
VLLPAKTPCTTRRRLLKRYCIIPSEQTLIWVASSLIIDHIRALYCDSDTIVGYYYCSWDEEQIQTPSHFTCSLLRQFCSKLDFVPTCVTEFYQKTRNEVKDQTWFSELQDVVHRVVKTFMKCFIVIDALDELPLIQRTKILQVVRRITDVAEYSGSVRVFATSRPHIEIPQIDFKIIEIAADEHDLRTFMSNKIQEHPDRGQYLSPLQCNARDWSCPINLFPSKLRLVLPS